MRGADGYSLVELLAATAIAGVLAACAWPAFHGSVLKAQRAVARGALLEIATKQEGYFSEQKAYARSLAPWFPADSEGCTWLMRDGRGEPAATSGAIYRICSNGGDPFTYELVATPVNAQLRDTRCGTLRYGSDGHRGASGADCWR